MDVRTRFVIEMLPHHLKTVSRPAAAAEGNDRFAAANYKTKKMTNSKLKRGEERMVVIR